MRTPQNRSNTPVPLWVKIFLCVSGALMPMIVIVASAFGTTIPVYVASMSGLYGLTVLGFAFSNGKPGLLIKALSKYIEQKVS